MESDIKEEKGNKVRSFIVWHIRHKYIQGHRSREKLTDKFSNLYHRKVSRINYHNVNA